MTRVAGVLVLVVAQVGCVRSPGRFARAPRSEAHGVWGAVDAGSGDMELKRLRRRMEAEPENLAVRLKLAERYEADGYPEIAIEHYRLAGQRFGESEEVQVRLARALRGEGLTAAAVDGLEAWRAGHAGCGWRVAAWVGILRDELGQLAAGEAAHRAAMEKGAREDSLHNNLGYNLLLQGRKEEAAAEFRRALELNRKSTVAANNLATALAATPGEREAEAKLATALDAATAHNNLAAILMDQGRYDEARRELEAALRLNGRHAAALRNLALVAELDGKPAELPGRGKKQSDSGRQERP